MNAPINDGGPAYPVQVKSLRHIPDQDGNHALTIVKETGFHEGMTLRDWFAGQALQGYNANGEQCANMSHEQAAANAYRDADAMLTAREGRAGE